jgi:hypothetical protein
MTIVAGSSQTQAEPYANPTSALPASAVLEDRQRYQRSGAT